LRRGRLVAPSAVDPPGRPFCWVASLDGDELVEPADLTFDRLQPMALELERVGVEAFPGPLKCGPELLQALLQAGAAAFEDAHAGGSIGPREEREVDPELLVVPGRRTGLGE
jgi:hypothetical protein